MGISIIIGIIIVIALASVVIWILSNRDKILEEMPTQADSGESPSSFDDELIQRFQQDDLSVFELWKLTQHFETKKQFNNAAQALSRILERKQYPKDVTEVQVRERLAVDLFKLNQDQDALIHLLDILDEDSNNLNSLFYVGLICLGQRQYKLAIPYLERALSLNRNDSQIHMMLAFAYTGLEEYHRSKVHLERLLFLQEVLNVEQMYALGITELLMQSPKKAFTIFHELAGKELTDGLHHRTIRGMAFAMLLDNNLPRAEDYFSTALDKAKGMGNHELIQMGHQDMLIISYLQHKYEKALEWSKQEIPVPNDQQKELQEYLVSKVTPGGKTGDSSMSDRALENWTNDWKDMVVNKHTVLQIVGFKRAAKVNIPEYITELRLEQLNKKQETSSRESYPLCDELLHQSKDEFLKIARKILEKLGLIIREEIYHQQDLLFSEGDGIDFVCESKTKRDERYMVQLRRWNTSLIGDFVMKNLQDSVSMYNMDKGLFITTGELNKEAINYIEKTKTINVIPRKQLEFLLNGLIKPKKKSILGI